MRIRLLFQAAVSIAVLAAAFEAHGEVYRVGPGEEYALVSEVADKLDPGDVVEVTGDITDSFILERHGTHDRPITIRGITRTDNGRIVRPRITREKSFIIMCRADWTVLEGLDLSGTDDTDRRPPTGIHHEGRDLVVRNCRIHNVGRVIHDAPSAGNLTLEFCEFDSDGHGITLFRVGYGQGRGLQLTVEHCYFHDSVGFRQLCSAYPRNVIRYNWFENSYYCCLNIASTAGGTEKVEMDPQHTDIIGNVFFKGWSSGPRFSVLKIGGETPDAPGTEGDFHIAHNLIVNTRVGAPRDEAAFVMVGGNVEKVIFYNNVFLEYGVSGAQVYHRGSTHDSIRTRAFIERRGSPDPIVEGSNNWISTQALDSSIPEGFLNTLRGTNPLVVDLVNFDFRPTRTSPLVGAALSPLPSGRIVDLTPDFEPQRGIPADLKPVPRRKVTSPSIGPFEAAE